MIPTTTELPLVSIITLNYRQPEITIELLRSLHKLNYPNFEVIVVDNGPDDQRLKSEVELMASAIYCATNANLGFAGGNNIGVQKSSGKYLFFLNNDTEVEPDVLNKLIPFVENIPALGMLSPRICYYQHKELIQYAGFTPLNPVTIRNKGIGYGEKDAEKYHQNHQTAFIHGAAMLVPRRVAEEVGLMREDYFLYYEEYDWSARVKDAGYEIWYFGEAVVYHKESVSTGVDSPLKIYYLTRNRLLFARRNIGGINLILSWMYLTLIALPYNCLKWLIKRRPDLTSAVFRAWFWNITHKARSIENRN